MRNYNKSKLVKGLFIAAIVALSCFTEAVAQSRSTEIDSAEWVVNRFLKMQDFNKLDKDSILYMETYIYYRSKPTDTALLKRWYMFPNRFRAELWLRDSLIEGCYTDGRRIHREIKPSMKMGWVDVTPELYYADAEQYDIRGTLHNWKADAAILKYTGIWDFNGHPVYRILVETPEKYNKYYLFEKESGMLFLMQETNERSEYSSHQVYAHPDWHAYHEYQPWGALLLPSVESYQVGDDMVYYYTRFKNLAGNIEVFQKN